MSWYYCNTSHDRMKRGQVYWLEDTEYTANRVERGHIEPAEEPEWNKVSPDPWPKEEQ